MVGIKSTKTIEPAAAGCVETRSPQDFVETLKLAAKGCVETRERSSQLNQQPKAA